MQELVQAYYGQELQSSADLKTSACCDADAVPAWLKPLLARVHPEVSSRYYGCGLVCPSLLEGCRILDLGSGSGRDVYLLAQLVGERGEVVGVDMTAEQLAVAREHQAFHAEQFGFANVRFLEGQIERLEELDLEPGSFDVIVSNCVLNLSTDKPAVLRGAQRLLKPGGEFYFSDVYVDRRLPEAVQSHPVLYGECLGGALYWNDFLRMARAAGFADPRLRNCDHAVEAASNGQLLQGGDYRPLCGGIACGQASLRCAVVFQFRYERNPAFKPGPRGRVLIPPFDFRPTGVFRLHHLDSRVRSLGKWRAGRDSNPR